MAEEERHIGGEKDAGHMGVEHARSEHTGTEHSGAEHSGAEHAGAGDDVEGGFVTRKQAPRGSDAREFPDDVEGGYAMGRRPSPNVQVPPAGNIAASPGQRPVALRREPAPSGNGWAMTRALRHRDYRLFFTGAFLSNIGSWLQGVAEGYLVFTLTHSNALLGLMSFFNTIPVLILGPWAGVAADRFHRKKLLTITQSTFLLTTGTLAALAAFKVIQPWHLLVLAGIGGIASAYNAPAWQSLTVDFVGPEDLMNAIALNSMQFNTSRIVGGLTGGFIYWKWGPAWCFGLNSLSFIAVIVSLSMVHIRPPSTRAQNAGAMENFKAGMNFLRSHHDLMAIVGLSAAVTVLGIPYFALLPSFAVGVLHGDSRIQAYLLTAIGLGALMAAGTQAAQQREEGKGKQMLWSMGVFAMCLAIFALSNMRALSMVALVGCGAAMVGFMTTANTAMQLLVPDHMRGRLMGAFVMASFGLSPIGSLLMGLIAEKAEHWTPLLKGAQIALFLGATLCGLLALWVSAKFPRVREI